MFFREYAGFVLVLVFGGTPGVQGRARDLSEPGQTARAAILEAQQASAELAYAASAEGLKSLLEDWLATFKIGDTAKSEAILKGFAIPGHSAWFAKTFGDKEGPSLDVAYTQIQTSDPDWLKLNALHSVQAERYVVQVQSFANPTDTEIGLLQAALGAEQQGTPIYYVRTLKSAGDTASSYLGCFVYVDGGFRHLDRRVLEGLSTAPRGPKQLTMGKSVEAAKLIKRVPPVYPEEAIKHRLGGVVRLRVVIAKDGSVQNVRVVEGHAMLIQAAIDAVKQWKYQPTFLAGKPVEVETTIDVNFQLLP